MNLSRHFAFIVQTPSQSPATFFSENHISLHIFLWHAFNNNTTMSALRSDNQSITPFKFSFQPTSTEQSYDGGNNPRGTKRRRSQSATDVSRNSIATPSPFSFVSPSANNNRSMTASNNVTFDPSQWSNMNFMGDSQPTSSTFTFNIPDDDEKEMEVVHSSVPSTVTLNTSNSSNGTVPQFTVPHSVNFKFSKSPKKKKADRKMKLPDFEQRSKWESEMNLVQSEIKEIQKKMSEVKTREMALMSKLEMIEDEVSSWTRNYAKWNCDDLMAWIFQIDKGYFEMKCKINQKNFNQTFCETLNQIANRFSFGSTLFEGKHLEIFDILDVQQLFPFMDGKDCRKMYREIEKLTSLERNRFKLDSVCSICTTNRKQYALSCGHIYCGTCINRMNTCAFCKKRVEKSKMIKIFLWWWGLLDFDWWARMGCARIKNDGCLTNCNHEVLWDWGRSFQYFIAFYCFWKLRSLQKYLPLLDQLDFEYFISQFNDVLFPKKRYIEALARKKSR